MLQAAEAIIEYTSRGRDAFERDSALWDAVLYQIVVLGEAAKAASTGRRVVAHRTDAGSGRPSLAVVAAINRLG